MKKAGHSRRFAIVSVFMCNLMQMAMFALMPMLTCMKADFMHVDETWIQTLTTLPNLLVVLVAPMAGRLAEKVNKRMLLQISAGCYLAVAVGGFFFHSHMVVLYLWSFILGIAIGVLIPIASSLCSDFFEGDLLAKALGYQSTMVAVGGVLLSLLGGKLASIHWYVSYLTFLLIIPGLIMITFLMPGNIYACKQNEISRKIMITPQVVLVYAGIALVTLSVCNAMPMNISAYLNEIGKGDSVMAGAMSAIMQAGGAAAGIIFGSCVKKMKEWMFSAAYVSLALGVVCILTANILLIALGMFLAGYCMTTTMVSATSCISAKERPEAVTLGIAVLMAVANAGGFTAFFYTGLSNLIFDSERSVFRYILFLIVALIMITVTVIWQLRNMNGGKGK